ncbi:MAG: sarcosine oxidase subunit gamma [Alphaproteobacteria bacterium]
MSDLSLTAQSPLAGYHREFERVQLFEAPDLALVSIATPQGGNEALATAVASAFGASLPTVGQSTVSSDGAIRFMGLQPDQMFALFEHVGDGAEQVIAHRIGATGYTTDQSDGWAALRLTGEAAREALARICMLDLHPDAFAINDVTRTAMEHLGTIICRDGDDSFLLLSARSSARSFLHAVETSIINVL